MLVFLILKIINSQNKVRHNLDKNIQDFLRFAERITDLANLRENN